MGGGDSDSDERYQGCLYLKLKGGRGCNMLVMNRWMIPVP
jgi:hypothetical protein